MKWVTTTLAISRALIIDKASGSIKRVATQKYHPHFGAL